MSKERELLTKVIKVFDSVYSRDLINEIKELLAQPEPDPVVWKETLIEHLQSAFDSEMFQTEEGDALIRLEDAICYVEELVIPTREGLTPREALTEYKKGYARAELDLKRQPLSNLTIKEASRNSKDMSFYNGVKWAEAQHDIGVDDE